MTLCLGMLDVHDATLIRCLIDNLMIIFIWERCSLPLFIDVHCSLVITMYKYSEHVE